MCHFDDQLGIAGDFGAELIAVDAVCQLSLRGDERPRWGWVVAVQDARVAPETKGADFGQTNVLRLGNDPRMGFAMYLRLGGEMRQAGAQRRRRGKLVHLNITESDPPPWSLIDSGNGGATRAQSNAELRP